MPTMCWTEDNDGYVKEWKIMMVNKTHSSPSRNLHRATVVDTVVCKCWSESRSVVSDSMWPHGLYTLRNSPGQNTAEAFPFSRGSSQPRDWTLVSHIAGAFFTSWATGRPILCIISCISAHLTLMLYSFGCEVTKMQHRVVFVCLFLFTLVLGHLHHTYVDDSQIQISALLMSSSLVFTK